MQQFARISNSTGFVYCFSIVESNRRTDLAAAATPAPQSGTRLKIDPKHAKLSRDPALDADLNAFFPFDPYKLPLSHTYVDDVYREWASVALEEDMDSDEEDEDGEDVVGVGQDGCAQPPDEGVDEDEDESEDESQDSRSETESTTEPEGVPIPGSETDLLDATFGGMSISPGGFR